MKLEQAARQALGLLEDAAEPAATQTKADEGMVAQWDVNALETIAALREALAEPKRYNHETGSALVLEQAEQEPVAWMVYTADGQSVYVTDNPTDIKDGQRALPLYTNPVEPISQEPVVDLSKLRHEDKCCYWGDERFCDCGADSHELLKWYRKNAAPVRQVDLTDDEIASIGSELAAKNCVSDIAFARAVIAAYKEKNK